MKRPAGFVVVAFLPVAAILLLGAAADWISRIEWHRDSVQPSRSEQETPIEIPGPPETDAGKAELAVLPDLSKVDRRVVEPTYRTKPQYCLLVFGPRAETRVWLVEDGETLYVDRNADGDLTGAGNAVTRSERSERM